MSKKKAKELVTLRIGEEDLAYVDECAEREGINRSAYFRRMVQVHKVFESKNMNIGKFLFDNLKELEDKK